MMTIDGVMRLRGSEMNLYSPKYFASNESGTPVKQLQDMLSSGNVLLLGQEVRKHSPTVVTLDGDIIKRVWDDLEITYTGRYFTLTKKNLAVGEDWITDESWWYANPPIPPEIGYINSTTQKNMWMIRNRYLCKKDATAPRYVSIDRDTSNWIMHAEGDDLVVYQRKNKYTLMHMVFFVNGLCCYPMIETNDQYGLQVRLIDGSKYLNNHQDRDRGVVAMDFSKQCKLTCYTTSGFFRDFPELLVDSSIDVDNSSFLLVVDGRLYLPGEFTLFTDHLLKMNTSYTRPEYILDRMCCERNFATMLDKKHEAVRNLVAPKVDFKTAKNSFLIVLNRKNLKVINHQCLSNPTNQMMQDNLDVAIFNKLTFNGSAHGLLMDQTTRSVIDYTREMNGMTFYDEDSTKPRHSEVSTIYINPSTPLEIWAKYNNDMSATASMHDRRDVRGSAFLLRPKYTMLDFIFEG